MSEIKLPVHTNRKEFYEPRVYLLIFPRILAILKFFLKFQFHIDLKKIAEWPRCVEISSKKLEPHRIPFFLYDLSVLFHSYWSLGKENKEYRFISNGEMINKSRLVLIQALGIVIKNGMTILGVSTPSSM